MEMKSDIEVRRSKNEFGTLTWQLGEIWPTGGWGSLEYGTIGWLDGQVLGGRWKPLHHIMEQHLYRDVIAVCGADALCFVKNSNPLEAAFGKFQAVLFDLHRQHETEISSTYVALAAGPAIHRFCLGNPKAQHSCPSYSSILAAHQCTAASCVVILRLSTLPSEHLTVSEENIVFIVPPANMTIPPSSVSFNVSQPHGCSLRPNNTCSTVMPFRFVFFSAAVLLELSGFSFCFNGTGHVCYSCHQGAGKVSKKRYVPDHWRSQR
jgi:beta-mannosidase